MSKIVSVLGSTGSVGTQTLSVVRRCGFHISALTANRNIRLLAEQAREFCPAMVVTADKQLYSDLKLLLHDTPVRVEAGEEAICEAAALNQTDTVCNSLVGMAGIRPTLSAIRAGKDIALSNKETIVAAGDLVLSEAASHNVRILPVDSEHSAFFQLMEYPSKPVKLLLTASGGAFFGKTSDELHAMSLEKAMTNPNWSMGAKVTIDSATLMNKGMELIEAVRLFRVAPADIEVVVHRESIVHALIEMEDGVLLANMSCPDMELPIQYALTWPDRKYTGRRLSLSEIGKLTFYKPDEDTFHALRISRRAAEKGGLTTTALNAGNEALIQLLLSRKISFGQMLDLIDVLGEYLENNDFPGDVLSLDSILETDATAKAFMMEAADRLCSR